MDDESAKEKKEVGSGREPAAVKAPPRPVESSDDFEGFPWTCIYLPAREGAAS